MRSLIFAKYIIFIIISLINIIPVYASERIVTGRVIAADEQIPLSSCCILIWMDDEIINTGISNKDGNYTAFVMPASNLIVQTWPPSYYYECLEYNNDEDNQENHDEDGDDEYDEDEELEDEFEAESEDDENDTQENDNAIYLMQFYDKQKTRDKATIVSTLNENAYGINFELESIPDIGITGTIYHDDIPMPDITVTATSDSILFSKKTKTDANGNYTITHLEYADDYYVEVFIENEYSYFYFLPENQRAGIDLSSYSVNLYEMARLITPQKPYLKNIDIIVSQNNCIGGKVLFKSDEPLEFIWVNAWSDLLGIGNGSLTDEFGTYTICGLPLVLTDEAQEKGFYVSVQDSLYPAQFYPNAMEKLTAIPVESNRFDINITIRHGYQVSGKIIDSLAVPVPDTEIFMWPKIDEDSNIVGSYDTLSDDSGAFTFTNVIPYSEYILAAYPDNSPPVFYDNQADESFATPLDVSQQDISDIIIQLPTENSIRGCVFIDSDNTQAHEGILVQAWSETIETGGQATTDSNGCYEIKGLDPSILDYNVFIIGDEKYMSAFYYNNMDNDENNDTVYDYINVGETPISDEQHNLTLKTGYTISGLVTFDEIPMSGIRLEAWDEITNNWSETISFEIPENNIYNFELSGLSQGLYEIVILSDQYYSPNLFIELIDENIENLQIILAKFDSHSISGKIFNLKKNEEVIVFASSFLKEFAKSIELIGTGSTITYTIPGLMPSDDYIVEIYPENAPYQIYPNAYSWEEAESVDITDQNRYNIDFQLLGTDDTTTISGKIFFPESTPVWQIAEIEVFSLSTGFWESIDISLIDSPAHYSIEKLPKARDYNIKIQSELFQSMFYNQTTNIEEAQTVDTTDSIADSSIDFTLTAGLSISGIIKLVSGEILEDAEIETWSEQTGSWSFSQSDDDGSFILNGLSKSDDFIIHAWHENFGHFYYHPDKIIRNETGAFTISTTDGPTDDIIVVAEEGAKISGQVKEVSGKGLANIWVEAWSNRLNTGNSSFTDEDGYFEINGLLNAKDYQVSAIPDWFSDYQLASVNNIPANSTDVYLILKKGQRCSIQGFIMDTDNKGIYSADIELWSLSNESAYGWAKTDRNGYYNIKGLFPASDYVLIVIPPKDSEFASHSESMVQVLSDILKDINLTIGKTIKGVVLTKKSQTPINNAWVTAFSEKTNFWGEFQTSSDGKFEIKQVPYSDDFIVSVSADGFINQDKSLQEITNDINFYLEGQGVISGSVIDATTGKALSDARIEVFSKKYQGISDYEGAGYTNKKGKFTITGLKTVGDSNKSINDYVVQVHAQGFPIHNRAAISCGSDINFHLIKNNENNITGTITDINNQPLNSTYQAVIDVFLSKDRLIQTVPVENNGQFCITGLSSRRTYQLKFILFKEREIFAEEWALADGSATQNVSEAFEFNVPSVVNFSVPYSWESSNPGRKRVLKFNRPGAVQNLRSTTHAFVQLNWRKRSQTPLFSRPDRVSSKSDISVKWEKPTHGSTTIGYFTIFSKVKNMRFNKFNTCYRPPIRTRKITSNDHYGNDILYYFHVAAVDRDGRIGETTSIAFRIDTIAPTNVNVIAPKKSSKRNIQLKLGATGAFEMYLSNINYGEGGQWENWNKFKPWKLTQGEGLKKIYVQVRDKAKNSTNFLSTTLLTDSTTEPENYTPVATSFSISGREDMPLKIQLEAYDDNSDPLAYSILSLPEHGIIADISENGLSKYYPDNNFFGTDEFYYYVSDGKAISNPATVSITILPVNDPPFTNDINLHTPKNCSVKCLLQAIDVDDNDLSFNIIRQGAKGVAKVINKHTGEIVYTPNNMNHGIDYFLFEVKDTYGASCKGIANIDIHSMENNWYNTSQKSIVGYIKNEKGLWINNAKIYLLYPPHNNFYTRSEKGYYSLNIPKTQKPVHLGVSADGYELKKIKISDDTVINQSRDECFLRPITLTSCNESQISEVNCGESLPLTQTLTVQVNDNTNYSGKGFFDENGGVGIIKSLNGKIIASVFIPQKSLAYPSTLKYTVTQKSGLEMINSTCKGKNTIVEISINNSLKTPAIISIPVSDNIEINEFTNKNYYVFHAKNSFELEKETNIDIINPDDILSVNLNDQVTFKTKHFSAFGVGVKNEQKGYGERLEEPEDNSCFIELIY